MLVLTRKIEDAILVGDNVKITILSVSGDKVRLGIDAPKSVRIVRAETLVATIEQNRIAASATVNLNAFRELAND